MEDGDTSKPFKVPKLSKGSTKNAVKQTKNFEKNHKNQKIKKKL